MVKGGCEAKGVAAIIKDMNGESQGTIGVYIDASAAIGIAFMWECYGFSRI